MMDAPQIFEYNIVYNNKSEEIHHKLRTMKCSTLHCMPLDDKTSRNHIKKGRFTCANNRNYHCVSDIDFTSEKPKLSYNSHCLCIDKSQDIHTYNGCHDGFTKIVSGKLMQLTNLYNEIGLLSLSKKIRQECIPNFSKYIPIPLFTPLAVPKLMIHERNTEEIELVQQVFNNDRFKLNGTSKSETDLGEMLIHFPDAMKSTSITNTTSQDQMSTPEMCQNELYDKSFPTCIERFDYTTNLTYCRIASKIDAVFKANVYIKLKTANIDLCVTKLEMVYAAISSFFCTWIRIQCEWVSDFHKEILSLLENRHNEPLFCKPTNVSIFEVVLVLSKDAAVLIRHKNMAFLHTLAVIVDIELHELLVLVTDE